MNNYKEKKPAKFLLKSAPAMVVILAAAAVIFYSVEYARREETLAKELKEKLLRFHVVANSDSPRDQRVKLKVRDAVLYALKGKMENVTTRDEAVLAVEENREVIENAVRRVLKDEGEDYGFEVYTGEEFFPAKVYQNLTLPPGDYLALIIRLGEHEGKNWWCVLFPTLCFVDADAPSLSNEAKSRLDTVMTPYEYRQVTGKGSKVRVRSRFAGFLRRMFS